MKIKLSFLISIGVLTASINTLASETEVAIDTDPLTGITKLACEAILCLSSGTRPSECSPSLSHYFSINFKKIGDTIKERRNFLNLCPAVENDKMAALTNAISLGAGRCDADSLNKLTTFSIIASHVENPHALNQAITIAASKYNLGYSVFNSLGYYDSYGETVLITANQKPSFCSIYEDHEYTDIETLHVARYVGTPNRVGYWANPKDYKSKLSQFNARINTENEFLKKHPQYYLLGGRVTKRNWMD